MILILKDEETLDIMGFQAFLHLGGLVNQIYRMMQSRR